MPKLRNRIAAGERKRCKVKLNLWRLLVLATGLGTFGAAMAQESTAPPQLTLSSPTVKDMEPLPLKYSQTGTRPSIVVSPGMNNGAVNPPLEWSNVPPGTNAFVLIVSDHVEHVDVDSRQYFQETSGRYLKLSRMETTPRSCPRARFTAASGAMAGSGLRPDKTRRVAGRTIGSFILWTGS